MNRKTMLSAVVSGLLANDGITEVNPEFLSSALVRVEEEAYKADYEEIIFQDLFPIVDLADRTATSFGYYYVTEAGKAQLSNPNGNIAWIDSFVGMKQAPLHDGNVGYKYASKELERVGKLGGSLDSLKVETAISGVLQLAQDIAFDGDSGRGIVGFFNNPDIATMSPLAGVGGNTWALKTANEILADINYLFATAYATTKQVEFKPKNPTIRLMLATDKWSKIASTKIGEYADTTILEFIVNKCPYLSTVDQVVSSAQIATNKMRIYHYDKKKIAFYWGHQIEFKAPQLSGLNIEVPAEFSIGGLVLRKPLSCWDMDGI